MAEKTRISQIVDQAVTQVLENRLPQLREEIVQRVLEDLKPQLGAAGSAGGAGASDLLNAISAIHAGSTQKEILRAGMVVTIEPGVYIEGKGGIRIEDDALVTPNGAEYLTDANRELTELG